MIHASVVIKTILLAQLAMSSGVNVISVLASHVAM